MQKDRKKVHKKIVKYIRMRNKQLQEDNYVGCERFRFDLYSEDWYRWSNGSGGWMSLVFKMSDKLTGNKAFFMCNHHDYEWKMAEYANDFLIRCSDGHSGHFPPLHYIAYDVHEIIPYEGRKDNPTPKEKYEDGVIATYDWTRWDLFRKENL